MNGQRSFRGRPKLGEEQAAISCLTAKACDAQWRASAGMADGALPAAGAERASDSLSGRAI